MIVQVKTLEGRLFKVEAAPETNVKAVKDIIETSQPELKAARKAAAAHPIEKTGAELRAMMPWIGANKLVDKDKN